PQRPHQRPQPRLQRRGGLQDGHYHRGDEVTKYRYFHTATQHKGGTPSKGSLPYAPLSAQDGDCPLFHRGKSRPGYGAGGSAPQISLLPSRARINVASSANSRWPPTGMP